MLVIILFFFCLSSGLVQCSFDDETKRLYIQGNEILKFSTQLNQWKLLTERIVIEEGIKILDHYVFYEWNMKEIVIGSSVEIIKSNAFENCPQLTTITFNQNSQLKTIEEYAFQNCINLKSILLPKSLEKIDFKKVFENCTEIKIEIEEENEYCKIEDDDVCCKK